MFETSELIIFILAGLALNITPGPDMMYCAARSIGQGKSAGVVSAIGIGVGGTVHTAAAVMGLSVLVAYSSWAFLAIKYVGAAYLIYLGVRAMVTGGRMQSRMDLPPANLSAIFRQGMFTNVLNPKVALFFLSFLPQFVHPDRGSVALQTLILGLIFNINGTIVNVLVGWMFGHVGGWLERSVWWWKLQRWLTGSVLVGLGFSLALPDRR